MHSNTKKVRELLGDKTRLRIVYVKDTLQVVGEFNQWLKDNPAKNLINSSPYAATSMGSGSLYPHESDAIKALGLEALHNELCAAAKKQEHARRNAAEKTAKDRLDAMQAALSEICALHKCGVSYTMKGDTHGIYEDYLYIGTEVDGFYFKREIEE